MSRRKKFKDRSKAPGTPEIKRKSCEEWQLRHKRRLKFNCERQDGVAQWCQSVGVTLTITNNGHHWKFARGPRIVEWWPSSAKCVIDKRWRNGIHTHDVGQLILILNKEFCTTLEPEKADAVQADGRATAAGGCNAVFYPYLGGDC